MREKTANGVLVDKVIRMTDLACLEEWTAKEKEEFEGLIEELEVVDTMAVLIKEIKSLREEINRALLN